jgi:transposase
MDNSYKEVAAICGISESSVRRIGKVYDETGRIDPVPGGAKPGRKPILDKDDHKVSHSTVVC